VWLISVGYTAQLVPTLIRVMTVIKLVRAAEKMRFVIIDKKILLTRSVGFSAIAALYCMFWTIFDPPDSQTDLYLTQEKNDFGETIVSETNYCASVSIVWQVVMFAFQAFLLVCASLLAYQMRCVPNAVNDSAELAVMIYSSFIFLVLRLLVFIFTGSFPGSNDSLQKSRSLLCSIDVIANICIFFPRFFKAANKEDNIRTSQLEPASGFPRSSFNGVSSFGHSSNVEDPAHPSHSQTGEEKVSEISVEEEKQEENTDGTSLLLRFRAKSQSVDLRKTILETYGLELKKE